ncbi:phototropic-responsive NPH3 family protein [Striga asiatica]|uniref:Phototropic-responsive NPH3 family protein n=1 Tax=Striga asiatica TaxID=4170 RepID=A0A5A7QM29_STRAF|nr:phototropic-responsive NPH3 family protein [Striga asiatica]
MACMRLGSKSEAFHLQGQNWHCTSGLPSDVTVEIGEMSFHLHKFPLLSRSGLLEKLIGGEVSSGGGPCVVQLSDLPGGAKSFELVAKFCYGVKIELTSMNVVSLRCAAEHLAMTEDYGDSNLVSQTESFLNDLLASWTDTIKALETCEEVLRPAEHLHIVSRCINSLAVKACSDPTLSFGWPVDHRAAWNGICPQPPPSKNSMPAHDWWYEDVSFLSLPLYKRLIRAVEEGGMRAESVARALVFYANKYIPQMNRQSSFKNPSSSSSTISVPSESDQRALLEEIVELLPAQKGVLHTRFLLRLLKTAMVLQVGPACRESLERRVGLELDRASLEDLLVPNLGYSVETLYDVDCFQRILDHFLSVEQASPCIVEEEEEEGQQQQLVEGTHTLTALTMVANLVDSYLAEVAPDVNLKFPKFQALAAAVPDYARPLSDGIYRAIDIFLKEHPWLTDSEREQVCRLMNFQKLSLEASTHAAQNERLPLRVIVQVLFFEQLRLRTSISSWLFVSENLDGSQNVGYGPGLSKGQERITSIDEMRERLCELEKECQGMKEKFQKMGKSRRSWNIFCRRKSSRAESKPANKHYENSELGC